MNRKKATSHACYKALVSGCLLAFHAPVVLAQTDAFKACALELMENAASDVTVGDIRETCMAAEEPVVPVEPMVGPELPKSAIDRRLAMEGATEVVPFTMTPHKPNYIIYSYNFKDYQNPSTNPQFADDERDKSSEVDFQVSIKFPVWRNIFNTKTHLFAAYTNRSFWQVFDHNDSSPFRETDHEPELWLSHRTKWNMFGLTNRLIQAGVVHQSNGRSGDLSRSWNRAYANMIFERGNFYFGLKPWLRFQEDREDDDNPDIED